LLRLGDGQCSPGQDSSKLLDPVSHGVGRIVAYTVSARRKLIISINLSIDQSVPEVELMICLTRREEGKTANSVLLKLDPLQPRGIAAEGFDQKTAKQRVNYVTGITGTVGLAGQWDVSPCFSDNVFLTSP
jgi:hypothetical protein